ncbi:hypothetical protein ACFX11_015096 [Malus domestica]
MGFVVSHGCRLTETAGLVVSCAWNRKWNSLPATERARLKSRQVARTVGLPEAYRTTKFVIAALILMMVSFSFATVKTSNEYDGCQHDRQ